MTHPFFSLHTHGFLRVAVASPKSRVADPAFNAQRTIEMAQAADKRGAALVLFPELGISSYAIDDLLHQSALLQAVEAALGEVIDASRALFPLLAVGAPLRHRGRLYNCALLIRRGEVLAVTPKTYLPNYREFYERRHFASGAFVAGEEIGVCGQSA
ncbi:MAG: NAD(+) synthase, partial [Methylocystis sp.]|nr:NAD(+) synthase [Methylocystis sp.]